MVGYDFEYVCEVVVVKFVLLIWFLFFFIMLNKNFIGVFELVGSLIV